GKLILGDIGRYNFHRCIHQKRQNHGNDERLQLAFASFASLPCSGNALFVLPADHFESPQEAAQLRTGNALDELKLALSRRRVDTRKVQVLRRSNRVSAVLGRRVNAFRSISKRGQKWPGSAPAGRSRCTSLRLVPAPAGCSASWHASLP